MQALLFALALAPAAPSDNTKEGPVSVEVKDDHVDFLVGKQLVGRYHTAGAAAKPYFYPVNAPGGLEITRAVPPGDGEKKDHPHQKSLWFCHGDVIPEGVEVKDKIKGVRGVDFWSETRGHGKIVCVKRKAEKNALTTRNEWRTADGVKIMDEDRRITLHAAGGGYLLVFDIDLHAAVCPLTFGDTKEGSFGVRVREALTETGGKGVLTNADGLTTMKNVWGRKAKWCDYSGPVPLGGGTAPGGIAVFDDPKNDPPACWHSRNYGLMAANPFGRDAFPATKGGEPFRLKKGDHLKLRYGVYLHAGDVKGGKVAEAYEEFARAR